MKEYEVYELLQKYGIKTPKYKIFSIDEPFFFDHFPAVLKIASDKVVHKSDVGGVRTGIHSNEELAIAKEEMIQHLQEHGIFLDLNDKFIVEEQLEGDEFYIGGLFDPIFEEILLFGKGGILIEIERDICYIDSEAGEEEIIRSLQHTKISKLFPEYRGKRYDMEEVIETIRKFQRFIKNESIVEFDINPLLYTDKGLVAIDARVKKGTKKRHSRRKRTNDIFLNEKVAIFGATDKKEKVGYALAKNALNSESEVYFVNPRLKTLFGKRVYNDIDELPPIDTAVIAIPSKYVVDLVEKLAKRGVKNIIVISAGFKETGNIEDEKKLTELAHTYDLNIVGPNCLGIYNGQKRLNLTFAADTIKNGDIALVSQSGAVLAALLDKAESFGIGFSHILSLGNMADFDFADAIESLDQKSSCSYISVYAEGLQNGKAFLQAIRKASKPIMLFKAGKTEEAKKAAFSHTGNLSGNFEMLIGLSEAAGAVIKNDIDELIFAPKYSTYKEVLIITNAGGPGTILTDIVVEHGKKMYRLSDEEKERLDSVLPPTWSQNNPVDIIGDATSKRYEATLEILYKESLLIFVLVTPQFMTDGLAIAKIIANKPNIVPIFFGYASFKEVFEYFQSQNRLYFNDLENVANIL